MVKIFLIVAYYFSCFSGNLVRERACIFFPKSIGTKKAPLVGGALRSGFGFGPDLLDGQDFGYFTGSNGVG
jgi:hypothetical protein